MGGRASDPLAAVEALLAKAGDEDGPARRRSLEQALLALSKVAFPAAPDASHVSARADAYRAEILRRLGRRADAAAAYARVVESVIDNAEAAHRGLSDLVDSICGYDEALRLLDLAEARHPGRAWQWQPLREEAKRRRRLEAEAPVDAAGLSRLRAEVARRLIGAPCAHDDDRRPLTAEAALALGLAPEAVLPWLLALGACCCDCQVAVVRGPWEARRG